MAGNDNQQSTSTRDLVIRFDRRLWNAWDDAAVENILAPDLTFRGSLGETTVGRGGWRGYQDHIRSNSRISTTKCSTRSASTARRRPEYGSPPHIHASIDGRRVIPTGGKRHSYEMPI